MVGCHRVEQDVVDVFGSTASSFQSIASSGQGPVGNADALRAVVALMDPGTLPDPLVVRVHHARKIVVGVRPTGQVASRARDGDSAHRISVLVDVTDAAQARATGSTDR